eukprot:TRINITY_DN7966_c0_g1_i4.p1 TRINITY_DN7966_c0_g1~~TRINITY_DN7966_c0_g1_i4.p1  ORF type:complete len:455 (-),score=52.69 TRINITY_DN7966_c0_g1_i4:408-1772(-)
MRVGVVVLGDVGRSPRMCYHALSLAENGYQVDLIGYAGSDLPEQVTNNSNISVRYVAKVENLPNLPKVVRYFLKAFLQSLYLLVALPLFSYLDCILVQTPPGVPTLPVLYFYSFFKGTRLLVDFHNYSHTILSMSCGPTHPLVKLTKMLERLFGQQAVASFCVTQAMKEDLLENWEIESTVLHDRPASKFRPITVSEKHELYLRLSKEYPELAGQEPDSTVFTCIQNEDIKLHDHRPGLIVSSTSWTEDEDFSILLSALHNYEMKVQERSLPDLICIITGKGEQKQFYLNKIQNMNFQHVKFLTPWLTAEDYPLVLASADLGVSLHTSSSGLDLPMKVVDMFGCGLPVAAISFPAIGELVKDGENGEIFSNSDELSEIIQDWFHNFPSDTNPKHQRYRSELESFRNSDWTQNWNAKALPVFKKLKGIPSGGEFPVFLFFLALLCVFAAYLPTCA